MYEIGEGKDGTYILNANDLCTAPFLDLICKAGVDSLKIEGRAKTFYYVASVTAAYRQALDQYLADPMNDNFELAPQTLDELTRTSARLLLWAGGGPSVHRQRRLSAGVGVRGYGGKLGERCGALPAAGKMVPGRYPGGAVPGRPQHPAGTGMDRKRSRGACAVHAMELYTIPTPELPPMSLLRKKNTV